MSVKQKINTRSSTEAELVGIIDAMTIILWTRQFLMGQGFDVKDNIIYQDNQSTMLLAKNGRHSSGKNTRHIEIRYYFITDQIERGAASIAYCPSEHMRADFFTKPLQGSLFRFFRKLILNLPDDIVCSQECVATSYPRLTRSNVDTIDVPKILIKDDAGKDALNTRSSLAGVKSIK